MDLQVNYSLLRGEFTKVTPLSLYFHFTNAFFYRLLAKDETKKDIAGTKISKNVPIVPHLLFIDGYFLFSKASMLDAKNLMDIIKKFRDRSGHVVNFEKSRVCFYPKLPNKYINFFKRLRIYKF